MARDVPRIKSCEADSSISNLTLSTAERVRTEWLTMFLSFAMPEFLPIE